MGFSHSLRVANRALYNLFYLQFQPCLLMRYWTVFLTRIHALLTIMINVIPSGPTGQEMGEDTSMHVWRLHVNRIRVSNNCATVPSSHASHVQKTAICLMVLLLVTS